MRLFLPDAVALVLLCLASLLPASSALQESLKPHHNLRRLQDAAAPGADDVEYTLPLMVEAPGVHPLSLAACTTFLCSMC